MNKPFAALWCYPWDLLDEGLDVSLGRIADAGLEAISLAVSYHAGLLLLPHNPRTHLRFLEDGALYFRPPSGAFRGLTIQPRLSRLTEGQDPLALICEAADGRGLQVVAWTVCLHNSFQGARHPELAIQNALGDPLIYALCPAQPAVQDYLATLLRALSAYPLRALQLESYGYMGFPHGQHHEKLNLPLGAAGEFLMGLCFCPACQRQAEAAGVEWRALREGVCSYLQRLWDGEIAPDEDGCEAHVATLIPGLADYMALRQQVLIRLVQRLARAANVPLNLLGIAPGMIAPLASQVAEVTEMAYFAEPDQVAAATREAANKLAGRIPLSIGLDACPHLTPDAANLAAKVRAARQAGAGGLYLYNYGLMPLRSLAWVKEALEARPKSIL